MASFGTDAKNKIMVSRDSELGDNSLVLEAISDRFVKYFKCVFHRNSWYFINFCACKSRQNLETTIYDLIYRPGELLNFILLAIQFDMTDKFLSGKFSWYGWEVVSYLSMTEGEREGQRNPMCHAFPTEISCNLPNVGAAGNVQNQNGMCVLTQNIINEKIYLVFWFWFEFLGCISILFFLYRAMTIMIPQLRFYLLYSVVSLASP